MPGEKELSEPGSINCASSSSNSPCNSRISSQNNPNSLVDRDDDNISTGVVVELKEGMSTSELKEGATMELKEEGASIKLKEEGANIEVLKEEVTTTELKKGSAIDLMEEGVAINPVLEKEGVAIDLKKKEHMDTDLKEKGATFKESKEEGAPIELEKRSNHEKAIQLKRDGTRLFQQRDYEGAACAFDNAIKLLPKEHDDIAFLHCNIAACYMHMNPEDYERAIDECNSALEASPKYTKALLKRARCFEALDRLDLACKDAQKVLSLEPNNITALELFESIREEMEETEMLLENQLAVSLPEEPKSIVSAKERIKRKVSRRFRNNSIVEEEVWLIHDDEMQENDQDSKEEECDEENDHHMTSNLNNEENDSEEMRSKHDEDNCRYTEQQNHMKHSQYRQGPANDECQLLHHASWDMEEMHRKQTHSQNKALKELDVRSCQQHQQEMHPKQDQISGVNKRQKQIEEEIRRTSPSKNENRIEMYERHIKEKHSERHISRGEEDKQEKQMGIKVASHGKDQQYQQHIKEKKDSNKETRTVKFVLGDDIRIALVPENCSLIQLINIARCKYSPHLKAMLLKFKDIEGDLVTITSTEELRWVEDLKQGPARLYIKEVSPEREITRDIVMPSISIATLQKKHSISECGSSRHAAEEEKNSSYVDDWMVQFARLFKNHVGFDSDAYVDLRDLGTRLYYEAMEDTITSEEAQEIFHAAEAKFQEMAALALFNWGNIHMSRAKKRLVLSEDATKESVLSQVKSAYEWACAEYVKAGKKFEDTVDVKPDFYEGLIALGHQQFEQAKLSWRYADACKVDMGTEVLELFNRAEDNMEKGMEMWEGIEYLRVKGMSKSKKEKILLDKLGLDGHQQDLTADEAVEQASNMRSQLNISWGTILYERSVVELKLGLSSWEESLTEAIEKFKTGGASLADISVMVKNHCINEKTQEGLSFKIDEIVQAWNEMYDAKKLKNGSSSFRLEPLFRRQPSKLHNILEHIKYT